jgi:multiple antibiotic resistance protein
MIFDRGRVGAYVGASVAFLAAGAFFFSANHGAGTDVAGSNILLLTRQIFSFDGAAFWSFFAALFAIMNPMIAVPLFVRMTKQRSVANRRRLAYRCSATVLLVLIASALFGQQLLDFFAIGIGSFRIAGGIILILMGLAMMRSAGGAKDSNGPGDEADDDGESQAICPMAIPMLAGPGAIAAITLQSQMAVAPSDFGLIACTILAIVAVTYLALRTAVSTAQFLGPTGLMVVTRLIGMVVTAIAIDMMVIGLRASFPAVL